MFEISAVYCEYQQNPIGIGVTKPRLGWKLHSDERAVIQTAYEIEIAAESDFASILWQSGRVNSEQSTHVEQDSFVAESCKRYYYRVRAWNQNGDETAWSAVAFWEMGLLSPDEWLGDWIAAPLAMLPIEAEPSPLMRRSFELTGKVKEARVYATALGIYELELNGQRVGDSYFAPGWTSYNHTLQTQTYDVTDLLKLGGNAIGASLGNGWYKGNLAWGNQRCVYGDRLALLLQMHIVYEDGREEVIVSDTKWKAAVSPIQFSEIYHGETYDARLEQEGWTTAAYEDNAKEWQTVEVVQHEKHMLRPQANEPVRKQERLKPIALITTPKGETVLDFGQNMVGWVQFAVKGEAGSSSTAACRGA